MAFLEVHGVDTATSKAASVVANARPADPFTKTGLTFTQVASSTSENWAGFYVTSYANQVGILSVWSGATSSEVRVASMPLTPMTLIDDGLVIYVPIPVASGTRLSVSIAGRGLATADVQIAGVPSSNFSAEPAFTAMDCGPFLLSGGSTDYGDLAIVDPGGTANTLGSYTEISHLGGGNDANNILNGNSLGSQYKYIGFAFSDDSQNQLNQDRLWTVAHGAAASEVDFITALHDVVVGSETNKLKSVVWIPWDRALGDRLSAKMQSSDIGAATRLGQVAIYGLR